MDVDAILTEITASGRAKIFLLILLTPIQILSVMQVYVPIFLKGEQRYRCYVPGCDNTTSAEEYDATWINYTIPRVYSEKLGKKTYSSCEMYSRFDESTDRKSCNPFEFDPNSTVSCNKWIYSSDQYTLVDEWTLVCKDNWLLHFSNSIYMAGNLLGIFSFGIISDKYGRRPALLTSALLVCVSSISTIFSSHIILYITLRFVTGASAMGMLTVGFVLITEWTGTESRGTCSIIYNFGYQISELLVVGCAYFIQNNWRYLQAATSLPTLYFLTYICLLPESVRWLISKSKYEKAEKVIKRFASWQGNTDFECILDRSVQNVENETANPKTVGVLDLFRTPALRKRTVILFIIWFCCCMMGYGIIFSSQSMRGSIYVNFLCLAAGDVTGSVLSYFVINKVKRRRSMMIGSLLASLLLASQVFTVNGNEIFRRLLPSLATVCMTLVFNIIYLYTTELFPTEIRSIGMGATSTFGRIGGIVAPFLTTTVDIWRPLPFVIMASGSLITCLLAPFLPETKDRPLNTTIYETENRNQ